MLRLTARLLFEVSIRNSEPRTNADHPAQPENTIAGDERPRRSACRRREKSAASPVRLTGSTWNDASASSRQIAPATPGKYTPGCANSKYSPINPRHHQQVHDVGIGERVEQPLTEASSSRASLSRLPARASRSGPPPSPCGRSPASAGCANRARQCRSRAWPAPRARQSTTLWRTACSTQSSLRPRCCAIVRAKVAAKFSIFWPISPLTSPPPSSTGCAAPIVVPGAIAARFAASVMKVPADAALAPDGAT